MQDDPPLADLVEAVAAFLRERATPALGGHAAYEARVSAGVLDIVARALRAGDGPAEAERERLRALLGRDGDLTSLNAELAGRLASGALTLESPGLADHLWATTLDKAAVDQPAYAAYRRYRPD